MEDSSSDINGAGAAEHVIDHDHDDDDMVMDDPNIISWMDEERCESLGITLEWGEYYVLDQGELSASDDCGSESSGSYEEAIEVPDDEVNDDFLLSERQGEEEAMNAMIKVDMSNSNTRDETSCAPTLMGMPDTVLEIILHYATSRPREMCNLERVCKRIHGMVITDEFSYHHPCYAWFYADRETSFFYEGLRQIRRFQNGFYPIGARNHILSVLGEESCAADAIRTLAAELLSRMLLGSEVHFRLRGDTVGYIAELLQSYMVRGLEEAIDLAIHSCREGVVMEKDVAECFGGHQFHPFRVFTQSNTLCNVAKKDKTTNSVIGCSCSFPSNSGNAWSWPDDDCHDVLPPEAGRRIIRRLAYMAGVREMVNEAFILAETRLLHAMGLLLVDAYESSVELAKTATYLDEHQKTVYLGIRTDSVDMFEVPSPPMFTPSGETIYTIVPGQIRAAAKQRNILPFHVYGDTWVASPGFTVEDEKDIEKSYYYEDDDMSDEDTNEEDEKSSFDWKDKYESESDYSINGDSKDDKSIGSSSDEDLNLSDDVDWEELKNIQNDQTWWVDERDRNHGMLL